MGIYQSRKSPVLVKFVVVLAFDVFPEDLWSVKLQPDLDHSVPFQSAAVLIFAALLQYSSHQSIN